MIHDSKPCGRRWAMPLSRPNRLPARLSPGTRPPPSRSAKSEPPARKPVGKALSEAPDYFPADVSWGTLGTRFGSYFAPAETWIMVIRTRVGEWQQDVSAGPKAAPSADAG